MVVSPLAILILICQFMSRSLYKHKSSSHTETKYISSLFDTFLSCPVPFWTYSVSTVCNILGNQKKKLSLDLQPLGRTGVGENRRPEAEYWIDDDQGERLPLNLVFYVPTVVATIPDR